MRDGPIPDYQNFYEEYDKYQDYGIATYRINESYDVKNDAKYLRKSLLECRAVFGKAYQSNSSVGT